jgi:hypothetical protein
VERSVLSGNSGIPIEDRNGQAGLFNTVVYVDNRIHSPHFGPKVYKNTPRSFSALTVAELNSLVVPFDKGRGNSHHTSPPAAASLVAAPGVIAGTTAGDPALDSAFIGYIWSGTSAELAGGGLGVKAGLLEVTQPGAFELRVTGDGADSATVIVDDGGGGTGGAGAVGFTSTSFSAAETAPLATVTVGRTGGSQGAASIDYDTSNGTATAGQDYTAVGGTLEWANGDTANKSFHVPILDDVANDPGETFSVSLSQPTGVTVGSPAAATVTILDNENMPPCVDGEFQVCLLGRFLATIHWVRPNNQGQGEGRVTRLTDSSASFEFFEPGNVEVVLKMKDACALPAGNPLRNFWPFVAGLTNVRVELTIIDTASGAMRRFYNALGQPFFTPAADSPDGKANPPGAIQATTQALGAFPTCDV